MGAKMSSFNCEKCGLPNLDSEYGYIAGCEHYPPEFDGRYKTKILQGSMDTKVVESLTFYRNGQWKSGDWRKVIYWEEIE